MELKEISKDIYDVDAWLDECLGKKVLLNEKKTERGHGRNIMLKYCLMHGKMRGLTQQELADRIGADKGYISRLSVGLLFLLLLRCIK